MAGIVGFQVDREVMRTIHPFMHHKRAGLNERAFTGLENHRTDGQLRRSAPLQDFDVGGFLQAQGAIPGVGDPDREGFADTKLHVPVVDYLPVDDEGWRSAATPVCQEERSKHQQDAAQGYNEPGEFLSLFFIFVGFPSHPTSLWFLFKLE
jgi:hypothetical protein